MVAGMAAAGVAIAGGLALAVKGAADFEAAMRNVNSISGLSEEAFRAQGAAVLDLSRQLPQSATTLAEGLYEIASSGFQGAEGLEVLEQAGRAASAGLTDTQTSAKAIVGVLNAYGLEASDAARVSDVLFQTVNLGVLSFEDLAQNLGDVVGISAAAGISIEQVGAAIAAITLSGVPAAEAFTQLKELTKNLIKPSDELAAVYRALGINITRDLADPAIGLHGVMEKLRVATGGNAEAFLALFPTIRASQAAFALAANDGENYARTTAGITDETVTAGATMRAFDEQMKAVSNQWKLFTNNISAGAIELGTHLLPIVADTLSALRQLGESALPSVQFALAALSPFFTAVAQVGGDVVDIVKQLVDNLGPAAKGIAGLAALGVIGALNGLAEVLSFLSGILADHPELVAGVVAAYIAWKAAMAIDAILSGFAGTAMVARLAVFALGDAFATGAAQAALFKGALAAFGIGALVIALGSMFTAITNSSDAAEKLVADLRAVADLGTIDGLAAYRARLMETDEALRSTGKAGGSLGDVFRRMGDLLPGVDNGFIRTRDAVNDVGAELERLNAQEQNFIANSIEVKKATGLSYEAVADLAKVLKVDLTQGYEASGDARQQIIDHYDNLVVAARGSSEGIQDAAAINVEALMAEKAAVDELAGAVEKAFASATDIVSGFSEQVAKEKGLQTFLEENLRAAEEFAAGIQVATEKGLDPSIIAKLLQAGPEAAAPFLQAIAADHSGNLVALANETEAALGAINTKVVAFARLTQQAINDVDDSKLRALGDAMLIQAEIFDAAGARTREALSEKLQIPIERVDAAIKEFGLTVATTMPTVVDASVTAAAFGTALDALPAKLVENGRSLDVLSEAGRSNRTAIDEVIAAAQAHAAALGQQGATMDQQRAAFDGHIGDLRRTLEQAGYTKGEIDALTSSINLIPGEKATTLSVSGVPDVVSAIGHLTELFNMPSYKQVDVVTVYTDQGSGREYGPGRSGHQVADGGIFRFYGAGGFENHVAQIAPAGITRIWAEPETGGEAYIPLATSKRGRSTVILSAVAQEFGYGLVPAAQGFAGGGYRSATPYIAPMPTQPANIGGGSVIDDAAAARIAKALAALTPPTGGVGGHAHPIVMDGRLVAKATATELRNMRQERS